MGQPLQNGPAQRPLLAGRRGDGSFCRGAVVSHIGCAVVVKTHQGTIGTIGVHNGGLAGIDDAGGQAPAHGQREKCCGDFFAAGQAERDVGYAQHGLHAEPVTHIVQRFQRHGGIVRTGADGHCQCVHDQILFR